MVKVKDLPQEERPRERLITLGSHALNMQELVATVLGTGTKKESVLSLSEKLLTRYTLKDLSQITVTELTETLGISTAKACQLLAAIELGKRLAIRSTPQNKSIQTVEEVAQKFMPRLRHMKKEMFYCLYVNTKLRPIKEEVISMGGISANAFTLADVFRPAITESAAGLILIHNHPSGDPEPSKNDLLVTKKAQKAGALLGIEILDHIIIGDQTYLSFKELGFL